MYQRNSNNKTRYKGTNISRFKKHVKTEDGRFKPSNRFDEKRGNRNYFKNKPRTSTRRLNNFQNEGRNQNRSRNSINIKEQVNIKKPSLPANQEYLYGFNPVRLAIINNRRNFYNLYINQGKNWEESPHKEIKELAEKRKIKISLVEIEELNKMLPDINHQGMILKCGLIPQLTFNQFLDKKYYTKIIALDQIQDSHNVGAIIRSVNYFGCDCIISTQYNSSPFNATASKCSAGLMELTNIVIVTNLSQALTKLKQQGYWVVGTEIGGKDIYQFEVPNKYILVIGNENKGIRQLVKKQCDWLVNIPGKLNNESLNVSVATGIILSIFDNKLNNGN